ncbi:MAG: class I SAM-dependent methyltransferase [Ruminococcaceae bacterium]|nr:class I SAM-dependent methyltransferase [Oscillospiraceae bacterium]
MRVSTKILLKLNKLFKAPVHPLNLQNDGVMSYAMWQYTKGAETIKFYLDFCSEEDMFKGKTVLDIGCGAAGKSLYYASRGANVIGVEILEKYRAEASALADELGLSDKFTFVCADAASLPFEDSTIDTIIMNDAMEHVSNPEAVIDECMRVLTPGGRLFVNFPPINHPFGAHLSDLIYIPWVHLFFSEAALVEAYKELAKTVPDGDDRVAFRISKKEDGSEYFSYINHMSIKRFNRILKSKGITPAYLKHIPLRSIVKPLAALPLLKECFVKMVVCVFKK